MQSAIPCRRACRVDTPTGSPITRTMLNDADTGFAEKLAARLPELALQPAEPRYLEEPRGLYAGRKSYVARPNSTEQVAALVAACHDASVGILPYGGGTGLVSGQISTDGAIPLILSLEKMTTIREVIPTENVLIAEAGATLVDIHAAADTVGKLFPLTYASKDSARIGGALAVNSGGLNVLRYGMARDLCLGIEAVMPDGQVLHGLKRLRKDNTGYDIRHLLIGSEGTLGVITAAALTLAPRPRHISTAFLAVAGPSQALNLLDLMRDHVGESISAFELLQRESLDFLGEAGLDIRHPFDTTPEWSVLTEIGTGPGSDPEHALMTIFEEAMERGLVIDGSIAQSGQQRDAMWAVREGIPAANRRIGGIASHDISLPLSEIPQFLEEARQAILAIAPLRINAFGHLGDGNLHYNIFPPKGETRDSYKPLASKLSELVYEMVSARNGSFSAEHGVGRIKRGALQTYGDPVRVATMKTIKAALDPKGIMNPGAVLDLP